MLLAGIAHSNRVAIISQQGSFTYAQLIQDVHLLTKRLTEDHRLQRGDRIGILMPRSYDFVVAFLAAWASGGIAVPLYPHYPKAEVEYMMRDSLSSLLLHHKSLNNSIPNLPFIKSIEVPGIKPSENGKSEEPIQLVAQDLSAGALLIYTSGTTGNPKGVLMNFRTVESQIDCLVKTWRWSPNDHILHVLPLHHIHGLVNCLLCSLSSGAVCEFLDPFDALEVWNRWKRPERDLTLFMAVPTIYSKLLDAYGRMSTNEQLVASQSCSQFRLMVSGSAALPSSVFQSWASVTGHSLLERYGMTEVGMALGNPMEGPRIMGTVGVPFPGVKVRIVDERGNDVTDSEESGELQVKGSNVFTEYWKNPNATRETFTQSHEPWFKTGDIAVKKDGTFRILGRASADIIKTGGYKISALEIERELLEHSALQDVAIVGIPDEVWGEIPALVATYTKDHSVTLEELTEWLKLRLAKYKIPKDIVVLPEMPRNPLGKVNKKYLGRLFNAKKPASA